MSYDSFITESARAYGIDLTTARVSGDKWVADVCVPMTEGHWEMTNDGWVHRSDDGLR